MRFKLQCMSLLMAAIFLLAATHAAAQAGRLDPTFASGGIFATSNDVSSANAVAIQSDGKIVVAGNGFSSNRGLTDMLIRLNTDGTPDNSFGSNGVVNLVPADVDLAFGFFGLAIQPDGKIVAAASGGSVKLGGMMSVVRVDSKGNLDTSFGDGGFTSAQVFPLGSGDLALQSDGKIVVVSGTSNPSLMARFTSGGQPDSAFGGSGVVNLAYPSPTHIAVQSNGKILVSSGEPSRLVNQAQPAPQAGTITRYNADGSVDVGFGTLGSVPSLASASAMLLQSDGKIVVAGSLTSAVNGTGPNNVGFGVVRYTANGALDSGFGAKGVAIANFGSNAPVSGAFAVALQSDGKLVAAGAAGGTVSQNKITSSFGLARFTPDGKLDATFGTRGRVITTVASNQYSWVADLAIQSDGKIVAAGTSQFNTDNDNAYVARYLGQ